MGLGAAAFTISFLLIAVQRSGVSYWAFTFPALVLVSVGTDFEFNVVNVSKRYVLNTEYYSISDFMGPRCTSCHPCPNRNSL
jgi:hypothetical protein